MKKSFVIFVIVCFVLTICVYSYLAYSSIFYPLSYEESIFNYSMQYDIKSEFIASVINAESGFNKNAVSKKGAIGLMQIMPQTAEWISSKMNINYDENMLFSEDYNINLGTYYISYLFSKFEDETVVLCAYNAGEGTVKNWLNNMSYSLDGKTLKIIPYKETNVYVQKVLKSVKIYKNKLSKV